MKTNQMRKAQHIYSELATAKESIDYYHCYSMFQQRLKEKWRRFTEKTGKAQGHTRGGCPHREAGSELTRSWVSHVLGQGSTPGLLWLVLNWKQGRNWGSQLIGVIGQGLWLAFGIVTRDIGLTFNKSDLQRADWLLRLVIQIRVWFPELVAAGCE